jgi:predicted ArsR family transcriptional regulator
MQPATRLRILEYLRKNQTATAHQIGTSLGMTPADIRYHLAILEESGLAEVIDRRVEGRGRPEKIYCVSSEILGSGLAELVEAMAVAWWGRLDGRPQESAIRLAAQALLGENGIDPALNLTRKLALLVDRLNQLHYRARWEAGAAGARVILGHCPYKKIIDRHPELCRLDRHLMESQLALTVRQVKKLEPGRDGYPRCIFVLA